MNIALIIGKKNSTGLPNKNIRKIMGRPSAEYAFLAAKHSLIEKTYVSTDSEEIKKIGESYGATIIDRPPNLAKSDSLTEDVLTHAYGIIKQEISNISTISLLFSNTPTVDVDLLNSAIIELNKTKNYDSIFSVANYDMFTPSRARKINNNGIIEPFIDLGLIGNVSSIRNSAGSVYYCDLSIQVMKEVCLSNINEGNLPFKWQGKKSKAVFTDFGFDIDSEWQIPVVEYWLRKKGFTETAIPWGNKND